MTRWLYIPHLYLSLAIIPLNEIKYKIIAYHALRGNRLWISKELYIYISCHTDGEQRPKAAEKNIGILHTLCRTNNCRVYCNYIWYLLYGLFLANNVTDNCISMLEIIDCHLIILYVLNNYFFDFYYLISIHCNIIVNKRQILCKKYHTTNIINGL